jgi:isocitrate dehydrogenase
LDEATEKLLENNNGPSRNVGEIDNRGSHYYIAKYWAEALANQNSDASLKAEFTPIAKELAQKESVILKELNGIQGTSVNIGGYYMPNEALVNEAMRPSKTFNAIIS